MRRRDPSRRSGEPASAALHRASLEALEQGVLLVAVDGEVLLLNRAAKELIGYDAAELTEIFKASRWTTHREDGSILPSEESPVRRTMATGEASSGETVVWTTKDGRPVTLRISTQPVIDETGTLTGVVAAVADVTEERAAEREAERHLAELTQLNAELQQAVSIKNRFLATATHDMRSPLTAIIGFASLLGRDDIELPQDQRIGMIRAIERQGRRLEALVQDLLAVSVIDGEVLSIEPQPVELGPSLHQIAADAGLDGRVDIDVAPGVVVNADPLRLAQMVTNLLQNASRYGLPPFRAAASTDGAWVVLRICDEGEGVAEEFVPRLFDRFSTASRTVEPEGRGTGLGLAIVQGLARLHGGDVWYEPNRPHGACFALRLPTGPEGLPTPPAE